MIEFLENEYDLQTTQEERDEILKENHNISEKITSKYELDNVESAISWTAGLLAGLMDAFFLTDVNKLSSTNKIGIGGKLKDSGKINKFIDQRLRYFYGSKKIDDLEAKYWVPYDPSNNAQLIKEGLPTVLGLHSPTHRLTSPGHDPILGFYYGVRDIMHNTFTTIDNAGNLITIQRVVNSDKPPVSLLKAIWIQLGHLRSDLSAIDERGVGLPFPFLGQIGRIKGKSPINEMTFNRLVKNMQLMGYNFNHSIALGVPGFFIEMINRLCFFAYQLYNGASFKESLPIMNPKLDKMLFRSYLVATTFNVGKLALTNGNIFAFNPNLWTMTLRYGLIEYKRLICNTVEKERYKHVHDYYQKNNAIINKEMKNLESFYGLE